MGPYNFMGPAVYFFPPTIYKEGRRSKSVHAVAYYYKGVECFSQAAISLDQQFIIQSIQGNQYSFICAYHSYGKAGYDLNVLYLLRTARCQTHHLSSPTFSLIQSGSAPTSLPGAEMNSLANRFRFRLRLRP